MSQTATGQLELGGRFIVLEGSEGCGKSTQLRLLDQRLRNSGVDLLTVRDPGSTPIGERIRSLLLDPVHGEMAMRCEMLLYMAARAQMMKELILPALAARKLVLCDRFVSSTLAYQLGGDGLSGDEIRRVADVAIGGRWPDLTILLHMPVERSFARIQRGRDRIEQRPREYHEQVVRNYLAQAQADPARWAIIEADAPEQTVHDRVWNAVEG